MTKLICLLAQVGCGQLDCTSLVSSPRPAYEPAVLSLAYLAELVTAGAAGTTAAKIRGSYEKIFQKELHEKTIGMTLYRLSKDKRSRREGRTWFFAEPKGEAKNPGVGAPGK